VGSSLYRAGKAELKRDAEEVKRDRADEAVRLREGRRAALRMDAPPVDPALLEGAQAVFVAGTGWRYVKTVNRTTVTVVDPYAWDGFTRVPMSKVVDYR
jgi:hypothetical protein